MLVDPTIDLDAWREPVLTFGTLRELSGLSGGAIAYLTDHVLRLPRVGKGFARLHTPEQAFGLRAVASATGIVPARECGGLAEAAAVYGALFLERPDVRERSALLAGWPATIGRPGWTWCLQMDGQWPAGVVPPPAVAHIALRALLHAFLRDWQAWRAEAGLAPPPPAAEAPRQEALH